MRFGSENEVQIISRVDFTSVEMRVVRMVCAAIFLVAGKPAYLLHSDFGREIGMKQSQAQNTHLSQWEEL